ncbi:hypothetical protein ACFL35_14655 [Candidatus Riflebacteria bacterium]
MKRFLLFLLLLRSAPCMAALLYSTEFQNVRLHIVTTRENPLGSALEKMGYYLLAVGLENRSKKPFLISLKDKWDFYRYQKPYDRVPPGCPQDLKTLLNHPGVEKIKKHLWKDKTIFPGQRDYFFLVLPLQLAVDKVSGMRYFNFYTKEYTTFGLFELPGQWQISVAKKAAPVMQKVAPKFSLPKIAKKPVDRSLTFLKIYNDFSTKSKLSPQEKGTKWKNMIGTGVSWTGIIRNVSDYKGYQRYFLDVGLLYPGKYDTEVIFADPEFMGPRIIGSSISFVGYIYDFKPEKPFVIYITHAALPGAVKTKK